jgi:hypothetical protein
MTKQGGMGDNFYVAGRNLSGDVNSLQSIGGGPAPIEMTGIDKLGIERLGGKRDGRISWTSYFNKASGAAHLTLSPLPTADVVISYFRGTAQGNEAAAMVAKQANYDPNRGEDGSLLFGVDALANSYGLEWGDQITAGVRQDTTATSPATGLDMLALTSFGWQAYLQVFAFTGTSVTITLQDSADNSAFAGFTGSAFTVVSAAPASQRLEGGRVDTVRRYVRAITAGTFTVADFAIVFVKNTTAVVF